MFRVKFRMLLGMLPGGLFLMFIRMQLVAMRQMRVMSGGFVILFLMGLVRFAMMMGSRFKMLGGLFMMIMLGHCTLLRLRGHRRCQL